MSRTYSVISLAAAALLAVAAQAAALTITRTSSPIIYTDTGISTVADLINVLPSSPASVAYLAGSATFGGSPIANPAIAGNTLTWIGSFEVPAGQARELSYQVTVPNVVGTYTNSAVGQVGTTQIDTTVSTADNAPSTATKG